MLAILVPLMLAAQQPPDIEPIADVQALIDRNALEGAFVEVYKPYTAGQHSTAAWDFPIYSAELTALIAQWRSVTPSDEVDALSDGDWLCQCQEWDSSAFQATIVATRMTGKDIADLDVTVDLGLGGGPEAMRMVTLNLKREEGAWKIDDIAADSFPGGLRQTLRETIAADGARIGERG